MNAPDSSPGNGASGVALLGFILAGGTVYWGLKARVYVLWWVTAWLFHWFPALTRHNVPREVALPVLTGVAVAVLLWVVGIFLIKDPIDRQEERLKKRRAILTGRENRRGWLFRRHVVRSGKD